MTDALNPEPLLRALHEAGVRHIIIGGFALNAHGVIRPWRDLDIVPDPDPANLERLAALLADPGARHVGLGIRCRRVSFRSDEARRPPVGSELPAGDAAWGSRQHAMGSRHRSGPRIRCSRVRVDLRSAWRYSPPCLCPRPPHGDETRGRPPSQPRRSETARCRLKTSVPTCLDCGSWFYCSCPGSPRLDRADLPGLRISACDGAPRQPESSNERCWPAAR